MASEFGNYADEREIHELLALFVSVWITNGQEAFDAREVAERLTDHNWKYTETWEDLLKYQFVERGWLDWADYHDRTLFREQGRSYFRITVTASGVFEVLR